MATKISQKSMLYFFGIESFLKKPDKFIEKFIEIFSSNDIRPLKTSGIYDAQITEFFRVYKNFSWHKMTLN